MIQNEFLDLQKISFPIDRKDLSVCDCMKNNIMSSYMNVFKEIVCLKEHVINIENIFVQLVNTLQYYNSGKFLSAYKLFYQVMDQNAKNFHYAFIGEISNIHGTWDKYCRVREWDHNKTKYSALEMLHLPFTKREIAGNCRFSMSGQPCSYMSFQDGLAWIEARQPEKFAIMKIAVRRGEERKYKLLKLDVRPHEYFRASGFNAMSQEKIKDYLIGLCYNLPLIAASSFICKNKEGKFKEEYIIPQMIMAWIKEKNSACVGVCYNTSTDNKSGYSCGGSNVVIPILAPDQNGYCTKMQEILDVDSAVVKFYDVNQKKSLPFLIQNIIDFSE